MTRLQLAVVCTLLLLILGGSLTAYFRSRPHLVKVNSGEGRLSEARKKELKVHVAGAVVAPGLYDVPEGSRVSDAIARAGGPLPDALLDEMNLAARVQDSQKISVPRSTANSGSTVVGPSDGGRGLINVNTASESELQELPGVGPALAVRILEYRRKNGPFKCLEDLDGVEGIGPSKIESMKDMVTF